MFDLIFGISNLRLDVKERILFKVISD